MMIHTCQDDARSAFARLSGHLRILSAGIILLGKLAMLAAVALAWMILASTMGNDPTEKQGSALTLALSAFTVLLVQSLANHVRWRHLLSTAIAVICAGGLGLLALWFRASWRNHLPAMSPLVFCATPVLIGAACGHILAAAARAIANALSVKGGQFTELAPTLGMSIRGEGYRADVDALLKVAEGAFVRGLVSARMLAIGGLAILLPFMAWGWHHSSVPHDISGSYLNADAAIWFVMGGCVGVIVGVALMPARRRWISIALPCSIVLLMGVGIAVAVVGRPSGPAGRTAPVIVIIGTALVGLAACLVARFIAGFILQRILPSPIAAHLTGQAATTPPPAPVSAATALCCEICGYHLEGLPSTRCESCGVEELRCPECGHQQPADTMHARGLLNVYKAHTVLRAISWLGALPTAGLLLLPWFFIGMETSGRGLFGSEMGLQVVIIVLVFSFILVAPLRMLVMHWRPVIIVSLLLPLVPLGAMALGGAFSRAGSMSAETFFFLPGWIAVSLLVPGLWIILLWFIYGRDYRGVCRWHSSRAFRRKPEQIAAQAAITGQELPVTCACGADVLHQPIAPCAACGTLSVSCSACETRRPIALARIGFESLVHRSRQMLLALLAGAAAVVIFIVGVSMMSSADQWRYSEMRWSQLADFCLLSVVAGGLARLLMIRRPPMAATLTAPLLVAGVYLLGKVLAPRSEAMDGVWMAIWMLNAIAALVGSAILVPLLMLAARILLPRAQARALLAWIRGDKTLDSAAAGL